GVDNAGKVVITRQLRRKQARAPGAAPASRADGRLGQRPLSFAGLLRFRITPRGTKRCSSSGLVVRGASRSSLPLWLSAAKPSEEHRGAPPRLRALSTADDDATRQKPSSPN